MAVSHNRIMNTCCENSLRSHKAHNIDCYIIDLLQTLESPSLLNCVKVDFDTNISISEVMVNTFFHQLKESFK